MKDTMGMITDGGGSSTASPSGGGVLSQALGELGENLLNEFGKDKDGQKRVAEKFLNKQLQVGDKWYLINSAWFQKWKAFVGLDSSLTSRERASMGATLEKICNSSLLTPNGQSVREDLTEGNDYFAVSEELWSYLVKVYSITSAKDIIERFVIDDAIDEDSKGWALKVEVRRLNVSLSCSYSKSTIAMNRVVTEEMSRQTPLEEVVQRMKSLFDVPQEREVRLFYKDDNDRMSPVNVSSNSTLNSTGYSDKDVIILDVQDPSGAWTVEYSQNKSSSSQAIPAPPPPPPAATAGALYNRSIISTRSSYEPTISNRHKPGLCGLSNLGNTCFMNSAIQCMSNVPLLTDYFREGRYKKEINKLNPLGRKGEIAEAYAELVSEMWSGQNSYTIPRNFKLQLSRFAPQFTGFQQQDSHELLAFLLDGLHEDLNRVLTKPYVEMGSHVGKTDEQFAEESWQDHKKRNDSIIVDTFHGLLKSTLNCLVCGEISIKFDPFCYLSVPLPSKKERLVEVVFVPLDPSQSLVKLKLSIVKSSTINELCIALEAQVPNVPRTRMVVCEVYSYKIFKVYDNQESASGIRNSDDIYIFELPASLNSPDHVKVKLHLRESGYSHSSNYFGLPLFLLVPRQNLTYGALYQHIANSMRRFLKDAPPSSSSDEINSNMNKSLKVRDEDSQHSNDMAITEDDEDSSVSGPATRSSLRLKNEKIKSQKLFNMFISKNDNYDYETPQQPAWSDDTPFEISAKESANQPIAVIAELSKQGFNSAPIDNVIEHPSCSSQLVKKKDVISLSECFNLYTKVEELSEQDYWYCSKCKNHQQSTKKFDLWNLPPVLVVHLKRFSYSRYYRDKIDTLVDFPLRDLDLSSYLINKKVTSPTNYNLIAVSNHYGSLGGGHYTAFGQNRNDGQWYYFDDSSVSTSDEGSVCTNAAYLLIYLRQDLHSISEATNPTSQI